MPNYPQPSEQWLAQRIAQLAQDVAALKAQQTQFICDAAGKAWVIIGNLTYDNAGNATGIGTVAAPKWGIASIKTGSWVQVA